MKGLNGKTIQSVADEQGRPLITFTDGTGLLIEIVQDEDDQACHFIELQLFEITRRTIYAERY